MTEEQYTLLSPYKNDLEEWCVKQSNVNGIKIRAIWQIRSQFDQYLKPLNYSCYNCVNAFMHETFNILRKHESTIS